MPNIRRYYFVATALLLLVAAVGVTGCTNTFDGMGRDIENAGQTIQQTF